MSALRTPARVAPVVGSVWLTIPALALLGCQEAARETASSEHERTTVTVLAYGD